VAAIVARLALPCLHTIALFLGALRSVGGDAATHFGQATSLVTSPFANGSTEGTG